MKVGPSPGSASPSSTGCPSRYGATSARRSPSARRWRPPHGSTCAVTSTWLVGCRSGRSKSSTRMSGSSGQPGPLASSPATTATSVASARCTGSCSATSSSPKAQVPTSPASAAGRGGAEAIWIPTALLPRYGVTWTADDEHHITAHHHLGTTPIAICLTIDDAAAVRAISFQRWGDPDTSGTWGWHSFGGEITGHRTFAGLTIPSHGRLGSAHRSRRTGQRRVLPLRGHIVGAVCHRCRSPVTGCGRDGLASMTVASTQPLRGVTRCCMPLGAGQHVVRARGRFLIEMAPVPDATASSAESSPRERRHPAGPQARLTSASMPASMDRQSRSTSGMVS